MHLTSISNIYPFVFFLYEPAVIEYEEVGYVLFRNYPKTTAEPAGTQSFFPLDN